MKKEELIKDLQYCEDSMERLADRTDIWQDRMVFGLFKVLRDVLLTLYKGDNDDAGNIIHCRDCRYLGSSGDGVYYTCSHQRAMVDPTLGDYCSLGEMRIKAK